MRQSGSNSVWSRDVKVKIVKWLGCCWCVFMFLSSGICHNEKKNIFLHVRGLHVVDILVLLFIYFFRPIRGT